jgi:hypothetical protein
MSFPAQNFTKQLSLKDMITMLRVRQLVNSILIMIKKKELVEPNTLKPRKSSDQKFYKTIKLETEPFLIHPEQ